MVPNISVGSVCMNIPKSIVQGSGIIVLVRIFSPYYDADGSYPQHRHRGNENMDSPLKVL